MSVSLRVVKKSIYFSVLSNVSVVNLCIFDETCISLDSPIHAEQNGLCLNSVYQSIHKLCLYN